MTSLDGATDKDVKPKTQSNSTTLHTKAVVPKKI